MSRRLHGSLVAAQDNVACIALRRKSLLLVSGTKTTHHSCGTTSSYAMILFIVLPRAMMLQYALLAFTTAYDSQYILCLDHRERLPMYIPLCDPMSACCSCLWHGCRRARWQSEQDTSASTLRRPSLHIIIKYIINISNSVSVLLKAS